MNDHPARSTANRSGLAARLLLAFVLVVAVAGVTAWLVAGVAGPALFHRHLVGTGVADPAAVTHAEEAFRSASAIALSIALAAGLATSLGVAALLARRVGGSLHAVSSAAAPCNCEAAVRPSACAIPFGSIIMITEPSPRMVLPQNIAMWRSLLDIGFTTISSV